ncbi:MAG TPA: pseudouridine synthase, partial [Aquabacterium sp.]|nr:pseudouridine synthase [Aquabacterium sp.]
AVSREDWADRMRKGEVVDAHAHPIPVDAPYRAHTKLYYWRSLPFEHQVPFDEEVVFQDDYLVVAYKPHFLPVTPKGRYLQETLLVRLKRRTGIATLVPMHRLDRETAGLVAFTIQPATRDAYQRLFRDKAVHKVYEAIAPRHPSLSWPHTRLSRLQEGPHFMAMHEVDGPPNAETRIELLGITAHGLGHYRLQPSTGQKHQLRVHMNALGLPIANDRIYPTLWPDTPEGQAPDLSRPLQLLARALSFTDPITGQLRHFESQRHLELGDATHCSPG